MRLCGLLVLWCVMVSGVCVCVCVFSSVVFVRCVFCNVRMCLCVLFLCDDVWFVFVFVFV